MSFFGTEFIFDGIPCSGFQLMMYNVGQSSDSGSQFASTGSIVEETVSKRWRPYFYGVKYEDKLQFEITFGVNQHRIDRGCYLSRFEIAEIAAWLTGHDQYKVLTIDQPDMRDVFFRCIITELTTVTYGDIPWALRATVTCDSPYAYARKQTFSFASMDEREYTLRNPSSLNQPYSPKIDITLMGGKSFSIENETTGDGPFTFDNLPANTGTIHVDCDTCVITCDSGANMYEHCNLNFLRLVRGENKIKLTGFGTADIICQFPVNTGG